MIRYTDKRILIDSTVTIKNVTRDVHDEKRFSATLELVDQNRQGYSFLDFKMDGSFVSYCIQDPITGAIVDIPADEFTEQLKAFFSECISAAIIFMKTPVNRLSDAQKKSVKTIEAQYGVTK